MNSKEFSEKVYIPIINVVSFIVAGIIAWSVVSPQSFLGGVGFIALWVLFGVVFLNVGQFVLGLFYNKSSSKKSISPAVNEERFQDYIPELTREEVEKSNDEILKGVHEVYRLNDEIKRELQDLFNKATFSQLDESQIRTIAMKIYKLCFYRIRRTPYDITKIQVEPQQFIKQTKYLSIYKSIVEALSNTANTLYRSGYKIDYNETQKTLEVVLNESTKHIKSIN